MADAKYLRIWRNYEELNELTGVMRTGFARAGIYPSCPDGRLESRRPVSVAEHIFGVSVLFDQLAMFCPEVAGSVNMEECRRLLLYHEYGEIEIGDIPDDGRRDETKKDQAELEAMMRLCGTLPEECSGSLLRSFLDFQGKQSKAAQLVYGIDKIEFVLRSLIYEKDELIDAQDVDTMFASGLSEQDKTYARRTRSGHPVDIWSAHVLDLIRGFWCTPVLMGTLRAAVEDVRGEWFPWAERVLSFGWPE